MKQRIMGALLLVGLLIGFGRPALGESGSLIFRKSVAKTVPPMASQIVPTDPYSHGNPSPNEQQMLELVNRARANPYNECNLFVTTDDQHILEGLIYPGNPSIEQLLQTFSTYLPKPPLAFNSALLACAKVHSQDMANNDFQGHVSSDGSTLSDRMNAAGYPYRTGGENVYAYAQSLLHAQAAFLIDWGVPDLGHRKNMLELDDHPAFREVGISVVSESNPNTSVGPLVITQDFGTAAAQTAFIVGVVFRDANGNNFYDSGEGLSNVTIMPDHGQYYAVTSDSGGYAIPVATESGSYTLKMLRSDLPEKTLTVTVASQNVKADFPLGNPAYGTIDGSIYDGATGLPLSGVTVTLGTANRTYTTDIHGSFIFSDLPAAMYTVKAEIQGYTIHPNNFGIQVSAGQSQRLRLTATPVDNNPDDSSPKDDPNTIDPNTPSTSSGSCGSAGFLLLSLFGMAFSTLTERRQ